MSYPRFILAGLLAVAVVGGLVTSTFLNLLVVPAGYALIFHVPRLDNAIEKE